MKSDYSYPDKCEKCIHYDVCYRVSECLNHIPGFECDYFEEKRPDGEWIPCSERLPEEDGEYLIEWGADWGVEICIADYSQGGKYWYEDATGYEYKGVIAWMPLPTPYKRGETNETN